MTTHRWLAGIENLFNTSRRRKQSHRRHAVVAAESLETKVLLAADTLGLIQGTVFNDVSDNGLTGEDPTLAAATVQLYKDGGNLSFDSGGADDTLVGSVTTVAGGEFSFSDLGEGRYFVRQLALVGYVQHTGEDVVTVDISATDALGTAGTLIDDFTNPAVPGQSLTVNSAGTPTDSSAAASITSIGGERDITVTAVLGSIVFEANGTAFPSHLNYNANFGATGNARVVWDGTDGDATTLDPSGLGGEDLTAGNAAGFLVNIGTSQAATIQLIIHSGPGNSSTATLALPASAVDSLYLPYSAFTTTTGTGADFTNVGAIEFFIDAPVATTTTVTDLLQTQVPTIFTTDFANFLPMTLGDLVFSDSNNNGVFDSATETGIDGVAMTLFEDTNGNNEFDSGTDLQIDTTTTAGGGLYSFGNLFPGDYIVRIDSSNFAASGPLEGFESSSGAVVAADADVDGDNNDNNGYSLAGAVVTLAITLTNGAEPINDGDTDANTNLSLDFAMLGAADIIITKTDNVTAGPGFVIAGSGAGNLVYTITATNGGSADATGVTVSDTGVISANLPAGVTFVSALGSGGSTFNTTTGIWNIGNLAAGDTATLTVTLTVGATASDTLDISNTASLATINETEIDAVQGNDTSTSRTLVNRSVDIFVTKTVNSATITAGSGTGNLVFTVTAQNLGPSDASGVTISDVLASSLPAGVTFVSGSGSGTTTYNSTSGVWTIGDLATGDSETLTFTLTVGGAAANNIAIPNTATVLSVNETETSLLNNSGQASATTVRDVDVIITKAANTSTVIAGSGTGNLTYTITASNSGPSDASGVTVTDVGIFSATSLPGMSVVSATPSGSSTFDLSSGLWTIGNLASGATQTLIVTLTVGAAATNGQTINNTASLSAISETDRDLTNNTQSAAVNVTRNVDIQVTKAAAPTAPTAVIAGSGASNLVYTITARNNGISDASGVTISDTEILVNNLPAGVTFVSAVGSGSTSYNTANGIWTIGNLAVGASATLTVTLTVGASASDSLVISNTAALAHVNETDTVSSNNSQVVTTNVDRSVDIALAKSTINNPVVAGSGAGNLVYTVTAINNGPSDASGVSVRDNNLLPANLPVGVTFVSAVGSAGSTYNSTTGIWTINNLAAAATRTLTVTLTVGASAVPQTYNNTVDVATVTETDRVASNNSAAASTVFQRSVDIEVRKTATTGPIIAGSGAGNLVYTVTAQNRGPSNASGVTVSDTGVLTANLPAGVSFVSATGSGSSTFNTNTGIWTIGNLATSETATLTVVLTVGASVSDTLSISNTAQLSTVTETDSVSTNNSQAVTTQVDRLVDIVVTKSATPATVAAGSGTGNLVYTVTARNDGNSNASGVTVSDFGVLASNLPAGVTLVSGTGSGGSTFNTSTGIWTIGDLAAGASRTLTLTLTVSATVANGIDISNTATVSTVTENESRTDNNSQTATSRVIGVVDLRVVKTGAPNPVLSPGILTYRVVVTNHGTAPATGVVLSDNLGTGMTFSSGTSTQGTVTSSNGIVTTNVGTLAAGASATLTLLASVNVALDGTLVNTAVATADQTDLNPVDNTSSIETQARLAPTSVSGIVFQDLNKNGLRDASEKLLADVQVVLLGTDRNGVAVNKQTVTNSNGAYSFTNLVPGRYTVYEIQPGIYLDGNEVAGTGATGTLRNDAFLNLQLQPGVAATAFNFTEGAVDPSKRPFLASSQSVGETMIVSLPVTGTGSLSGSVATDANRSSTLDNGDVGLASVLVTLAGNDATGNAVLIHQTTDTLGRFSFRNLPAGQYSILESQPFGKTDGAEQAGTILPDQVLDNIFSMIALPNSGAGTGYNFLELPAAPGTTAATSPTLLTPTTSDVGLRPTFSWTSLTTAAKYEVAVNRITDNVGEVYRNANVTGTSITMPTDLALGAHRVWVRAINSSGIAGPWSQPLAFNVATQANALQVLGVSLNAGQKLDWADVPNARSYDLRLINVETGTVLANATNLPTSQYSGLATLPPSKYRYFVRGNTATSTGLWSDGFDYTVLSIPTLKSATSTDTAKPTLHWNPVTGATMYEVWLSKISENGSAQRVTTVNKTNATSIPMPTNLALGDYRYWVRAIDSQGKMTSWSAASDFKIEPSGKMLTPSGTTSSTTPTFTWQAVAGAVKYDLWVADQSGAVYVREQNLTGTSFTSTKGFVNGDYRAWVMPVGATVPGKWSTALAFTVKNVARPEFTSPGATTNATPKFQWTPAPNAVRYELWVDKVGGPSKVVHLTNLTTNSYKPATSLAVGSYRAWVRAFDATGAASVWSLTLDFRVV